VPSTQHAVVHEERKGVKGDFSGGKTEVGALGTVEIIR